MRERRQRRQIVEGFASAAMQKGFAAATIADIVGRARVSKATFYVHFTDKEAVYLHLHATVADALVAAMAASLERTAAKTDWRTRVRALVATRLDVVASDPAFLAQAALEAQVATPGARRARRDAAQRLAGLYVRLSEELAATTPEVDPLPEHIVLAGQAAGVAFIGATAAEGPDAVRALEDARPKCGSGCSARPRGAERHSSTVRTRRREGSSVVRCRSTLGALLALMLLVPGAAAAAASDDLAANPGSLARVPDRFAPVFRWWWPSDQVDPAELRTELQTMRRAGFSAAEQILLANALEWGSPAFKERLEVAARQAEALDQRLDVTLGPGWPVSSPVTEDLSKDHSSQDLHYGAVDLSGPTTYSGPVPDRAPPGRAAQAADRGDRHPGRRSRRSAALDPESAVDLTAACATGR